MKNQALFSSKDKSKKLKCRLLQFMFGVLRVKTKNVCVCPSFRPSIILSILLLSDLVPAISSTCFIGLI